MDNVSSVMYSVTMASSAIYTVLTLIANFFLFKKIGEKKWLGLVPIANDYILFRHFWAAKAFWAYIALYAFFMVMTCIGAEWAFIAALISSVAILIFIAAEMDKIRKAFGKNGLWTLGLMLLYPVFAGILAAKGEEEKQGK